MNGPKRLVLVTGASGFIGKHMVRALAANGWAVRAAARDPAAIPEAAGVERVALPDLASASGLDAARRRRDAHSCISPASRTRRAICPRTSIPASTETWSGSLRERRARTRRALRADVVGAGASGACRRPCHHRSGPAAAHRHLRPAPSSKPSACLPESGVPFTVLRPAVVYGRGVKGNIASLATLAQTPMPLPFGGLDNRRSLLAIDNLASAIELALASPKAEGETFLVADTEPISVADLVTAMREGLGRAPHLVARADRRGEAADGDLRQGERSGNGCRGIS